LRSEITDRRKEQAVFLGVVAICLLVIASDFVPTTNEFWSGHQVATSIVTGAVLAMVAIAGLDQLIARREAARWRPLALLIIERLGNGIDELDFALQDRTLGYCCKVYGKWEIPVGKEFLMMLIESLEDLETWEGLEKKPGLIDEVAIYVDDGESTLETWAPLLVADSRLAEIGACATRVHSLARSALTALTYIWIDLNAVLPITIERRVRNRAALLAIVESYREAVEQFQRLASEYRGSDDLTRMAMRGSG
jgi:hypothetical protein